MDIPHYVHPFIRWWTFGVNTFWLLWMLLLTPWYADWFQNLTFSSCVYILMSKITGQYGFPVFHCLSNYNTIFLYWLQDFTFLPVMLSDSSFSTAWPTLGIFCVFNHSTLSNVKWHFVVILTCICLMISESWASFHDAYRPLVYLPWRDVCSSLLPLF